MQSELEELKPQLIVKTAQAEDMMGTITVDRQAADETRQLVAIEEKECTFRAEEAQRLKDSCEANLSEALPALHSALKALKSLSKKDIVEVKSMKRPPAGVRLTMEMVCLMKEVKPKTVNKGDSMGSVEFDYWEPAKKMMGDTHFLQTLFDYDKVKHSHTAHALQTHTHCTRTAHCVDSASVMRFLDAALLPCCLPSRCLTAFAAFAALLSCCLCCRYCCCCLAALLSHSGQAKTWQSRLGGR